MNIKTFFRPFTFFGIFVAEKWFQIVIAVAVIIFSVGYVFGQYVHYKESNIRDLEAWTDCVRTTQLSNRAYEFCQEKTSENYIFKQPFDWAAKSSDVTGDE